MNIKPFIPPILYNALRKLKPKPKKLEYAVGPYLLSLPPGHTLPVYQGMHKLFDRFLPVLAKCVEKGQSIVDVGANVGDTPLMMMETSPANIICIEASDKYYGYLEKNLAQLSSEERERIKTYKQMVGTGSYTGELQHYGGSAKLNPEVKNNAKNTLRLDELLADESNEIALIKTDTDGFDFDVLLSAEKIIERDQPILFWENQMENEDQMRGYEALYKKLQSYGYDRLYFFDNFGNLVLELSDYATLKQLNEYIYTTRKYGCTYTIRFTDVLAATSKSAQKLEKVIEEYKKEWIRA